MPPKTPSSNEPLELMMSVVVDGFQRVADSMHEIKAEQAKLSDIQKQQSKAAYHAFTGCGKARYVGMLVEIESQTNPRGARARVAQTLDLTPARITQLLNSDKNRKNGK